MKRPIWLVVVATFVVIVFTLSGCMAGENSDSKGGGKWGAKELRIDFATYNPLSLVIRHNKWLEEVLGDDAQVTWIQSAGSNKANEALRAGVVDVGSTAGSASLLARANGSPIKAIDVYSQPEWSAIVVAADSPIKSVRDLKGCSVAATKGTDPYFFLLQSLKKAGLSRDDVEVQNLQHADGKSALENGSVDAWVGLDPLMATTEINAGSRLIYRNVDFNTYGLLNATESFLSGSAKLAQLVVDAYEKARVWIASHPEETRRILAEVAGIDHRIATHVLNERTRIDIDPVPGDAQREVLKAVGPYFVEAGDVDDQHQIDTALEELFDPTYARKADPTRVVESK